MARNFTIDCAKRVTTIRLCRRLTLDELFEVLDEVARADNGNRRLWDVTGQLDFNASEIQQIAARGRTLWRGPARVAYLASDPLAFGLLRMFEVYREQENYETRVFQDEGEALAWLEAWVE